MIKYLFSPLVLELLRKTTTTTPLITAEVSTEQETEEITVDQEFEQMKFFIIAGGVAGLIALNIAVASILL